MSATKRYFYRDLLSDDSCTWHPPCGFQIDFDVDEEQRSFEVARIRPAVHLFCRTHEGDDDPLYRFAAERLSDARAGVQEALEAL